MCYVTKRYISFVSEKVFTEKSYYLRLSMPMPAFWRLPGSLSGLHKQVNMDKKAEGHTVRDGRLDLVVVVVHVSFFIVRFAPN